eukprot:690779-Prymnesium_polylepis.4
MWQMIFYLNLYYITGISKALEPFACTNTAVGSYLRAAPSITCWEGEHLGILALDIVPLCIYVLGVPVVYAIILFRMVPLRGMDDARLNSTFGFIWSRFEPEVYWWEAVEFSGRKLPLVLTSLFIDDIILKCVVGTLTVGGVMAANFSHAPYIKRVYDRLDQIVSLVEVLIFLCGLLATYRQKTILLSTVEQNAVIFDDGGALDALVVSVVFIVIAVLAGSA